MCIGAKCMCIKSQQGVDLVVQDILPAVESNLSHPSQAMRCAALRLLCCFEQPAMVQTSTSKSAAPSQSSQVFPMFFSIQSQSCTVDSGRQAAVTIGKMQTHLEYGQIPPQQIGPVIRCLLGVLHIRLVLSLCTPFKLASCMVCCCVIALSSKPLSGVHVWLTSVHLCSWHLVWTFQATATL